MKRLLILRHAKSSWDNAYMADHERPLNNRGKQDAPRMGTLLRQEELTPDLIISSSAQRALTTAEAVALACGYEARIQVTRQLYHAEPETYLEVLHEQGGAADLVLVVGHNPGIEELVEMLTGAAESMPTAALAYVQFNIDDWHTLTTETGGSLVNLWRPRDIH